MTLYNPGAMSPEKTKDNPRGSGRNPRAGEPATAHVAIRLTETEHDAYKAAATKAGESLAEWIRAACAARLGKGKR